MKVTAKRLTDLSLISELSGVTMDRSLNVNWGRMLHAEHSPIRAILYKIDMIGIPTFVSVHYRTHKVGVEHFVQSNRDDRRRNSFATPDRNTPINHTLVINPQALMTICRRRLCRKADPKTVEVTRQVVDAIRSIDPTLAEHLVPMCIYRGNVCHEFSSCGLSPHYTEPQ